MFWHYTKSIRNISTLTAVFLLCAACVYRIDIQQGNLLDDSLIEQVEVGMTRSQVQFLLGTPMINDSFHQNRWDYTYSLSSGRSSDIEKRWFIVFFQEDSVVRLERDATLTPASTRTARRDPGVLSRVFSRLGRTEEADVRETLELPAAQGSSAPVRTQTVHLDENRTPAAQIEANVELSANPAVGSSAGEVEPNLPSEPQRLVEVENANTSTGEGWIVQLGSFSEEENARRLADRVATFGFTTRVSTYTASGSTMFRVRVGPELSHDRAMDIASSLGANGFVAQVITQD